MQLRSATFAALILTCSAALAAGPDAPLRQASPQPGVPTLQVYSRETLVDVTVTDAKSRPVRNLTRSDFTILEDGKPQPIRSFQEFGKQEFGTAAAAAHPAALPKLPANIYTNLEPVSSTGPANIILLDALNVPWAAQVRSRQQAIDYIQSIPPGTRIALMELAPGGLSVIHGFTTDPAVLVAAIGDKRTTLLPAPERTTMDCPAEFLDQTTLKELRDLTGIVAGTKGRKNLVWFTIGIKRVTDPQFRPPCEIDPTPALHRTYALLADAQIAVYSIDPRGLQNIAMASAGGPITVHSGAEAAGALAASGRNLAGDILSMESVAESTGGGAFYNTNGLKQALGQAIGNGSSYYTLSYAPPSAAYDGRHHTISVKIDRPALHLVYRDSYYAEDPTLVRHPPDTLFGFTTRDTRPTAPVDPLTDAMAPIVLPATQLLFDVRVDPSTQPPSPTDQPIRVAVNPKYGKSPLTRYNFLFAIPAREITFANADGGVYSGSLEFDIVAFDSDGNIVTSRSQTMKLPLTSEEYASFVKTPFQFFQQLDLPPGKFTLRAGILDAVSNKIGTIDIPVTIAAKPAQQSTAQPPPPAAK